MTTRPIRLIAMDMDGTLLNSDQELSAGNIDALKRARDMGVTLAICSGRTLGETACYTYACGLRDCALLSLNGSYCMLGGELEPYVDAQLSPAAIRACVELFLSAGVNFGCYWHNQIVYVNGSDDGHKWITQKPGEHATTYFFGADKLSLLPGANKIVYEDQQIQRIPAMRERLAQIGGLQLTSSWYDNIEILPQGAGKGAAVRGLAAKLGVDLSQVMVCGDNDNDLSMIECAGLSVAMGNATQNVKRAASFTSLSNDEDGVAHAIRRFVLTPQ